MARTESLMVERGSKAPFFELPAVNPDVDDAGGETRSLDSYEDAEALVIAFICNHCPYVKHIEDALLRTALNYQPKGVQFIGICSNNAETHPQDSFENMAKRAREKNYPFPYLRDEEQDVARSYRAVCTPDFFVYDRERTLVYRGRFDESRPKQGTPTGSDLRQALDELLETGEIRGEQHPSIGCNIKWKPEKRPA